MLGVVMGIFRCNDSLQQFWTPSDGNSDVEGITRNSSGTAFEVVTICNTVTDQRSRFYLKHTKGKSFTVIHTSERNRAITAITRRGGIRDSRLTEKWKQKRPRPASSATENPNISMIRVAKRLISSRQNSAVPISYHGGYLVELGATYRTRSETGSGIGGDGLPFMISKFV